MQSSKVQVAIGSQVSELKNSETFTNNDGELSLGVGKCGKFVTQNQLRSFRFGIMRGDSSKVLDQSIHLDDLAKHDSAEYQPDSAQPKIYNFENDNGLTRPRD